MGETIVIINSRIPVTCNDMLVQQGCRVTKCDKTTVEVHYDEADADLVQIVQEDCITKIYLNPNAVPPVCVDPAPILIEGDIIEIPIGDELYLSVVGNGTPPFTYQWYKDNVIIPTATAFRYRVEDPSAGDSGVYKVAVSNSCATVYSATIDVTIDVPPVVTHFTGYWGSVANIDDIVDLTDIQGLQFSNSSAVHNNNFSANFTSFTDPSILVYAEPTTELIKTKWFGTELNKGNIGGGTDLFAIKTSITGWRVYYTQFATQQNDTSIIFKIS